MSTHEGRCTIEVACDESGFVGGSLFGGTRVFAHASVHLDPDLASELAGEVRARTGAGADELKASRLNRPWGQPVARWLCGPDGPLRGRAVVHLTDTRLFGLARLAQVLLADRVPEGWWAADEDASTWRQALRLDAVVSGLPSEQERRLLDGARDLLWLTRSRRARISADGWAAVISEVMDTLENAEDRFFLATWASPAALRRCRAYVGAPPTSPLTEPLLPALRWAVRHWSSDGDVSIVHDEQSVLTPGRVSAIAEELEVSHPGRRLAGFVRVDSRHDPRVQIADLVAGVVRRSVEDRLAGQPWATELPITHLVAGGSTFPWYADDPA